VRHRLTRAEVVVANGLAGEEVARTRCTTKKAANRGFFYAQLELLAQRAGEEITAPELHCQRIAGDRLIKFPITWSLTENPIASPSVTVCRPQATPAAVSETFDTKVRTRAGTSSASRTFCIPPSYDIGIRSASLIFRTGKRSLCRPRVVSVPAKQ